MEEVRPSVPREAGRAKALRISGDELVRRPIDAVLVEPLTVSKVPEREAKIAEFLETARLLAEGCIGAEPYRFSRDELYDEREARWARPE